MKWTTIRRMIKKHQIDLLCIQKIKKEQIEKAICQALWGDPEVSWEMYLASNTAGGLLCLWSEKAFKMERRVRVWKQNKVGIRDGCLKEVLV